MSYLEQNGGTVTMWFKKKQTQTKTSDNTPRKTRLGAKLHDIMLDKQREKEEQEKEEREEKTREAKYEAPEVFEYLQDEFVKVANEGGSYYALPVSKLEAIMAENNWGSDKAYLFKELEKICKENWIKLTLSNGLNDNGKAECYFLFDWDSMWDFYS